MIESFKPQAYLLMGCPFCLKFLIFMSEARLADQLDIVRVDPQGPAFDALKRKLAEATQAKATFPTVEVEPGVYQSDSDQLIDYYARRHHINVEDLTALSWYRQGVFPAFIKLYKENAELKQAKA